MDCGEPAESVFALSEGRKPRLACSQSISRVRRGTSWLTGFSASESSTSAIGSHADRSEHWTHRFFWAWWTLVIVAHREQFRTCFLPRRGIEARQGSGNSPYDLCRDHSFVRAFWIGHEGSMD